MDIKKQEQGKSAYLFTVTLDEKEWQGFVDEAGKKLSAEIKIKGFREGAAPLDMVKSVYGETKLANAAAEIALQAMYVQILTENELTPVMEPKVTFEDFSLDKPLVAKIEITTLPEAELGDYSKLRIEAKELPEVPAEEVDKVISNLQKRASKFEDPSGPIEKGDWVEIDFEGFIDGVPFEGGKSTRHPLVVGDGVFVPGFEDALMGMKVDEEKTFPLTFPDDFHNKDLAGKPVEFKVKIVAHKKVSLPEVNDEFVKEFSPFSSVEALRADIARHMQEDIERQNRLQEEEEAIDALVALTKAELPESLIDREAATLLEERKHRVSHEPNLTWEQYLAAMKMTEDEFQQSLRKDAEKRLLATLALKAVREREGVEATDAEVDAEIDKIRQQYPGEQEQIDKQFSDNSERLRLKSVIAGRKALDALMKIARSDKA